MKKFWLALPVLFAFTTLCTHRAAAQVPAAPANATAQCNDGTYWTSTAKQGACSGHKGVKTWLPAKPGNAAAAKPAKPAAASGASNVQPSTSAAAAMPSPSPKEQASGAGQKNQVWVNTATNVYHCPGDRFYGKTKQGKFMTESAAQKAGIKPDHGNGCGK